MTSITASATFGSWEEVPGFGPDAPLPRLAHATVAFSYEGEFTGSGAAQLLLSYGPEGSGEGVGYERLTGTIGDEPGEVVLRHTSAFGADGVTQRYHIVEGSGTGAFAGTTGSGTYAVGEGGSTWAWSLDLHRS